MLLATPPVFADPQPPEPATGPALAEQIRNAFPDETRPTHGTLFITAGGKTRGVPVDCHVVIHENYWESVYDIAATNSSGAEQLTVIHRPDSTNEYLYARAASPAEPLPKPAPISAVQAAVTPLGGSDFSAADLGLDFLHWPQQIKLKGEMRLGQPCYVLESRDPAANFIVRVKSYIDKESNAPLIADAYDAEGHTVKSFSLHGSSFKKVHGHWQLENMEIKDKKKRSQTELKFDILNQ